MIQHVCVFVVRDRSGGGGRRTEGEISASVIGVFINYHHSIQVPSLKFNFY